MVAGPGGSRGVEARPDLDSVLKSQGNRSPPRSGWRTISPREFALRPPPPLPPGCQSGLQEAGGGRRNALCRAGGRGLAPPAPRGLGRPGGPPGPAPAAGHDLPDPPRADSRARAATCGPACAPRAAPRAPSPSRCAPGPKLGEGGGRGLVSLHVCRPAGGVTRPRALLPYCSLSRGGRRSAYFLEETAGFLS